MRKKSKIIENKLFLACFMIFKTKESFKNQKSQGDF